MDPPTARVNLLMAGGGVRLAAFVGALAAFRHMGVEVAAVAGASAGSIVGSFLARGWSVEQMLSRLLETDFTQFKDISLRAFLLEGGLYSGNSFEQWMDRQLEGATFRDLSLDLHVATVDLFGRCPFFFSRRTTPDIRVSRAVRCSMSIPWVWRALRQDEKLLADGQLVPWIAAGVERLRQESEGTHRRTIMLRIISEARLDLRAKRYLWPWDFAMVLLDAMLSAIDNQRVPGDLWSDTILIDVGGTQNLQFQLSREEKMRLFACGQDQAHRYFHKGAPKARPEAGATGASDR